MGKYTWDDIIINPNTEEAKNCIGKEVYYSDNPNLCLSYANNSNDNFCGIIREIKTDVRNPFVLKGSVIKWTCIIRKKEEPKPEPKYVPFKYMSDFIDKCDDLHDEILDFNLDYAFLSYRGIWLKDKITEEIKLVSGLTKDGLYVNGNYVKWENLLSDYIFLDNSPCGKQININTLEK